MGVAVGDALGMPVETLSRAKILEATGGTGVTGFVAPLTTREWVKGLKAGDTTDDTQLMTVVTRSLIRMRRFDIEDMAAEHVRALAASTFGWGKTTERAIEEIRDGIRLPHVRATNFGPKSGAGNGVIMKIAPLAIHRCVSSTMRIGELLKDTLLLGGLTHHDPCASITAYCIAQLLCRLFHEPARSKSTACKHVVLIMQELTHSNLKEADEVTARLWALFDPDTLQSSETLARAVGNGFHCLDTMAFTIGTFMRHPTDFRAGVLEAVNAGGDADTNASIVGALIGINCGLSAIPEEWRDFNPTFRETLTLAEQLCA